eukprot:761496-Hanusia_phi.AAC.3
MTGDDQKKLSTGKIDRSSCGTNLSEPDHSVLQTLRSLLYVPFSKRDSLRHRPPEPQLGFFPGSWIFAILCLRSRKLLARPTGAGGTLRMAEEEVGDGGKRTKRRRRGREGERERGREGEARGREAGDRKPVALSPSQELLPCHPQGLGDNHVK